jgi:pimeloyl-ACP methyl ester carboxylesterase
MWDEQADYFSQRYQVVRYDQRGHGMTDRTGWRILLPLLLISTNFAG